MLCTLTQEHLLSAQLELRVAAQRTGTLTPHHSTNAPLYPSGDCAHSSDARRCSHTGIGGVSAWRLLRGNGNALCNTNHAREQQCPHFSPPHRTPSSPQPTSKCVSYLRKLSCDHRNMAVPASPPSFTQFSLLPSEFIRKIVSHLRASQPNSVQTFPRNLFCTT